ncbi:AN1-like zinc finger protein [Diaporthe sp. PMI_573]|jgi:predicted nucleic acid binding AN1-type Zn finger protein|nr:AN1-like zinc finger protein [Diaporthaceae sp. PMI_573]
MANRSSSSEGQETSYVNMTEVDRSRYADATLVGKHCEAEYCNQLDFLPFYCQSCEKTFCLDHRTESAHKCAKEGAWAERKRLAQLARPSAGEGKQLRDHVSQKPCASPDCKTTVGTSLVPGVHCQRCNRDYCLKHRLKEEHNCDNLVPIGARPGSQAADKARSALQKLRLWGAAKREAAGRALPKAKPTSASQRIVAVNNLKKTAKGDEKLAPEKRVYLFVEAEAATTTAKIPKGQFFYSKDWVVGRILDAAARSLQVENVNNQSSNEQDKLRVFHVEGGRVLEFSEKVGAALVSGNTIVLLRGVGPAPDLIEM